MYRCESSARGHNLPESLFSLLRFHPPEAELAKQVVFLSSVSGELYITTAVTHIFLARPMSNNPLPPRLYRETRAPPQKYVDACLVLYLRVGRVSVGGNTYIAVSRARREKRKNTAQAEHNLRRFFGERCTLFSQEAPMSERLRICYTCPMAPVKCPES